MINNLTKYLTLILLISCISCRQEKITLETSYFKVGISGKDIITSFFDRQKSVEYLPKGESSPLLTIYGDSAYIRPSSAEYNIQEKRITLKYPNGSQAVIGTEVRGEYLRFELLSLEPRNGVEAIVWGPYSTSIDEKIGETICVVRNKDFAIGMQALNINIIEGLPDGDDNGGGGGVIEPLPGQYLPDSLKGKIGQKAEVNVNISGDMPDYIRLYRGSAAVRKPYDSDLQLFARDRRIARVIKNWLGNGDYTQYAEPIDVDFIGSAVALFGCPEQMTLDIIEKIELGEGLPHPMLDGVWIKRSSLPGEAYLLNEGDPIQSIKYAKACGFRLIHIGDIVDKLTNDSYSGFYPDIKLQDAYAKRLAEVCNETGIDLMDFDGFGGESPTGHGTYGAARFIDTWYRNIDRYRLTCGAGTFHYYWHIYAFMNWGEPWYNALRESQVNYRIENQRYFERNLTPGMLGWFTLNPEFRPEEVEWIQARSAAFDAGYLLRVDESIEKNGFRDQLFETIRDWQQARRLNAYTAEQKERMKNPKNEFHIEKTGDETWNLFPVKLSRGFEHKLRAVQTGEPVSSKLRVNNPFEEQPLQFYVSAVPTENDLSSAVSHIQFKINNYQTLDLNIAIKSGDRLLCDGNKVYQCDKTWNKLKVIYEAKIPVLENGDSEITVTSDFTGPGSPKLEIEFKSVGKPEKVKKL